MKIEETLKHLQQGKKVRRINWFMKDYIYLINNETYKHVEIEDSEDSPFKFYYLDLIGNDWEIYSKPLTFLEAMEALREGKNVRRKDAPNYYCVPGNQSYIVLSAEDVTSDDWEIK